MQQPELIQTPFANEEGSTRTSNRFPLSDNGDNTVVSQKKGWQEVYSQPLESGGEAPKRIDMNTMFNWLTSLLFFAQKGWIWNYDNNQAYYTPALVWAKDNNNTDQIYFCKTDVNANGTQPKDDATQQYWIPFKDYLKDKIPVNDATITLKGPNNATYGSFSVNQNNNKDIEIPVRNGVTTFKLVDDKATSDTLGTISANQGETTEVKIPKPRNGKTTFNFNGKEVGSWTADQENDQTIDVSQAGVSIGNGTIKFYTKNGDTKTERGQFSANQSSNGDDVVIPIGEGIITVRRQETVNSATSVVETRQFNVNQSTNTTIDLPVGNGTMTFKFNGLRTVNNRTLPTFAANQGNNVDFDLFTFCGPVLPVGSVIPWAGTGTTPPTGWLFCDGSEYATTGTYEKLYNVIGYSYGQGNNGKFKVPNLQRRFIEGANSTDTVGTFIEAGLPNITGVFNAQASESTNFPYQYFGRGDTNNWPKSGEWSGAFYRYPTTRTAENPGYYAYVDSGSSGSGGWANGLKFDASKSSNVYKDNTSTVQPPAVIMRYLIRYYE